MPNHASRISTRVDSLFTNKFLFIVSRFQGALGGAAAGRAAGGSFGAWLGAEIAGDAGRAHGERIGALVGSAVGGMHSFLFFAFRFFTSTVCLCLSLIRIVGVCLMVPGISGWFAGTRVGRAMEDAAATTTSGTGTGARDETRAGADDGGADERFFSDPATAYRKCLGLLRVSHACSLPQLRAAFREAALECHPDRPGGSEAKMVRVWRRRGLMSGVSVFLPIRMKIVALTVDSLPCV
jgi:hypothetical protein